jgi:hypothetical protein
MDAQRLAQRGKLDLSAATGERIGGSQPALADDSIICGCLYLVGARRR